MKNLFFFRHGPIREDFREVFYGQGDVPLSEEGKKRSLDLVEELLTLNIPFNKIFSSPLKRALFPAKILSEKLNLPLEIREELKEINYGEWTGKLREEIYKESLFWERLEKDWLSPPKGESIQDLRRRAKTFWESLIPLERGNYLIFTHGGLLRALFCEILQLKSSFFFAFEIYHLKALFITLFEDQNFVIKGVNLTGSEIKNLFNFSYW